MMRTAAAAFKSLLVVLLIVVVEIGADQADEFAERQRKRRLSDNTEVLKELGVEIPSQGKIILMTRTIDRTKHHQG